MNIEICLKDLTLEELLSVGASKAEIASWEKMIPAIESHGDLHKGNNWGNLSDDDLNNVEDLRLKVNGRVFT